MRAASAVMCKRRKPVLWTPANTTTSGWYDAADVDTITESSGNVSQWDDKSGNIRHMVQPTVGNQPNIGISTINSIGVIDFNGGEFLYSTGLGASYSGNDIPFEIIGVFKFDARSATAAVVGLDSTVDTDTLYFFGVGASGTNWRHFRRDDAANSSDSDSTAANNNIQILTVRFTGSQLALWLNGNLIYNIASTLGQFSATHATIGAILAGGLPADVDIAEMVWLATDITATRQKIEGYLAWKWGQVANLPVGHPYKSTPPYV